MSPRTIKTCSWLHKWSEPTNDFKSIALDARIAQVLGERKVGEGFMHTMFRLHVDTQWSPGAIAVQNRGKEGLTSLNNSLTIRP